MTVKLFVKDEDMAVLTSIFLQSILNLSAEIRLESRL